MSTNMIVFDHLKLIHGDVVEMKRFRGYLLTRVKGQLSEHLIMHENDGSCCRRERWDATLERIHTAVKPPVRTVAFNLNDPDAL